MEPVRFGLVGYGFGGRYFHAPLLAAAPGVAFLGVDTSDSTSDARAFLASHPVSYPSYQTASTSQFQGLLSQGLAGLPTTIFIDRSGKVSSVHTGQYDAQGSLDADINQYALGG